MVDLNLLVTLLSQFGLPTTLLFAVLKGWVITAPHKEELEARIEELKEERDEWKALALRTTELASLVTTHAERRGNNDVHSRSQ